MLNVIMSQVTVYVFTEYLQFYKNGSTFRQLHIGRRLLQEILHSQNCFPVNLVPFIMLYFTFPLAEKTMVSTSRNRNLIPHLEDEV